MINNITVRYFVVSYEYEDVELEEVEESEFLAARGAITYERHTVFENGFREICLTKGLGI